MLPHHTPSSVLTVDTLDQASDRLASYPAQTDFNIILSGFQESPEVRGLTAQLIALHYDSFLRLQSQSVAVMLDLSKSDDFAVRKSTIALSKPDITEALLQALGEDELSLIATPVISRLLCTDPSFPVFCFDYLPRLSAQAGSNMISYFCDDFTFLEQTLPRANRLLTCVHGVMWFILKRFSKSIHFPGKGTSVVSRVFGNALRMIWTNHHPNARQVWKNKQ
jgi:hypothetical protein